MYRKVSEGYMTHLKKGLAAADKKAAADVLEKHFLPYYDNKFIHYAAILLRVRHASYRRFCEAVTHIVSNGVLAEKYARMLPYALPAKTGKEVITFPNIILPKNAYQRAAQFKDVSFGTHQDLLSDTLELINKEPDSPRWEKQDRGRKFLLKKERMTVSRMLRKYCDPDSKTFADHQIRDIAAALEGELSPLTLLYANTPEEFTDMYATGPSSCMSPKPEWEWMKKEANYSPASFYGMLGGQARGVYIRRGKDVAARVMTFLQDKKWYYGRVYAINDPIKVKFISEMEIAGIKPLPGGSATFKGLTAITEGVMSKSKKDYILPVPYFDNFNKANIYIGFIAKERKWVITDKPDKSLSVNFQKLDGLGNGTVLYAKAILGNNKCAYCSRPCGQNTCSTNDGIDFCQANCATASGYCHVIDGQGDMSWRRQNDPTLVHDHLSGVYYTNLEAMRRRAAANGKAYNGKAYSVLRVFVKAADLMDIDNCRNYTIFRQGNYHTISVEGYDEKFVIHGPSLDLVYHNRMGMLPYERQDGSQGKVGASYHLVKKELTKPSKVEIDW